MLKLKSDTPTTWVDVAIRNLDLIVLDHAHCEKKAAATALSLINRYPDRVFLVDHMIALAQEELEHFKKVLAVAQKRRLQLSRDSGDVYVQKLLVHVRKQEPDRLLDALLCAALIEARSCERFSLLAEALQEETEKHLYKDLITSEAGHYTMFLQLAREYFAKDKVAIRFDELASIESEICLTLTNKPRVHG